MLRADWVGALARSHNPVRGTLRGHSLLSRVPGPSQSVSARTPGYVWDLVLASSGGQTPVPTVPPTPTLGLLPPPKGDHCSGSDRRGASPRRALCRLPSSRPLPGLPPPAAPESAGPPAAPGPKGQATCSSSLQRASCRSCDQGPPGAGRGLHASRNGAPALGGGAQPVPPSRSEARPLSAVGSGGAASFSRDSHAARFSHFRGANRRVSAPSVSPTSRSTFESFPHPRKKLLTHQE